MNKCWAVSLLSFALGLSGSLAAVEYEGFTEPEQEIALSAPEMGVLKELKVKEGESVKVGQVLASLDNRVYHAQLAINKAKATARGLLQSAQAMQRLRQDMYNRLQNLRSQGAAQPAEVQQALAELEVAKAELQTARDTHEIHKLEVRLTEAQIERRTLRSPINGVVIDILKDPAEIVSSGGNEASHIMLIAQVDPLKVVVPIPTHEAVKLRVGQKVKVSFPRFDELTSEGEIVFISPVTDAGSDTVETKIRLDNSAGKLRSGLKCLVTVSEE